MRFVRTSLLIFLCNTVCIVRAGEPWATSYHKIFSDKKYKNQKSIIVLKENVPLFSQLIFGWNALRPTRGFFSYYVQARNAQTKQWGAWHHMVDWGADGQYSYMSKKNEFSQYVHVRLEINNTVLADAFRVKVTAINGAHLNVLKSIMVTIANFSCFTVEHYTKNIAVLPSVYIAKVPRLSQFLLDHSERHRMCSPTSCTMLLYYLTGSFIDPRDFAKNIFDQGLDTYGNWAFNTASVFEFSKGIVWFFPTRLNSFIELHKQLMRGFPVIVSVRGELPGAPKPYENGHLLVIVGWDSQTKEVICHDPAFDNIHDVLHRYSFKDFIHSWELSHRLVYLVRPL